MIYIRLIVLFLFFYANTALAGTNINLPYTLDFESGDSWTADTQTTGLCWTSASGSCTHVSDGCWSGSCGKIIPKNAVGWWTLNSDVPILHVRFLIKFGTEWSSTAYDTGEGLGDKLLIAGMTDSGLRPMIILQTPGGSADTRFFAPAVCNDAGDCDYECGTGPDPHTPSEFWPDGNDVFRVGPGAGGDYDYAGQWVCMEFEINTSTGLMKLYIWTQDGIRNGLYMSNYRAAESTVHSIQMIGGYYNQGHTADANAYYMLDEIKIDDEYIGPPSGFLSSETTVPGGITFSGCAFH